jgi:hypothetical protein
MLNEKDEDRKRVVVVVVMYVGRVVRKGNYGDRDRCSSTDYGGTGATASGSSRSYGCPPYPLTHAHTFPLAHILQYYCIGFLEFLVSCFKSFF